MKPSMKPALLLALPLFAVVSVFAHDDHAAVSPAQENSPLTTCIVSGDKLGEMGKPVTYVYKQAGKPDRTLQFCCKDCIKDFEKEPAKYLAKLDAATKSASCCELVDAYLPVAQALAADDLGKAKSAAATLAKQADDDGMTAIAKLAKTIANAATLPAARATFKSLSTETEPLITDAKSYVVMHCPMADADWIQTDAKVRNPYYGKMMLTCGAPKATH
jgi:hypothetical protein